MPITPPKCRFCGAVAWNHLCGRKAGKIASMEAKEFERAVRPPAFEGEFATPVVYGPSNPKETAVPTKTKKPARGRKAKPSRQRAVLAPRKAAAKKKAAVRRPAKPKKAKRQPMPEGMTRKEYLAQKARERRARERGEDVADAKVAQERLDSGDAKLLTGDGGAAS